MKSDLLRLLMDALFASARASGDVQRAATQAARVQTTATGQGPDVLVDDGLTNAKEITAALKDSSSSVRQAAKAVPSTARDTQPGGSETMDVASSIATGAAVAGPIGAAVGLGMKVVSDVMESVERSKAFVINGTNPVGYLPEKLQQTRSGQAFSDAWSTAGKMATDGDEFISITNRAQLVKDLVVGLAMLPDSMQEFNDGLLAGARELSRWNGTLAMNAAKLDAQQIQLDYRRAEATSGTSTLLTDSQMELKEALAPLREIGDNTRNLVGFVGTQLALAVLKLVNIEQTVQFGLGVLESLPGIGKTVAQLRDIAEKQQQLNAIQGNQNLQSYFGTFLDGKVEGGPDNKPPRKPGRKGVF